MVSTPAAWCSIALTLLLALHEGELPSLICCCPGVYPLISPPGVRCFPKPTGSIEQGAPSRSCLSRVQAQRCWLGLPQANQWFLSIKSANFLIMQEEEPYGSPIPGRPGALTSSPPLSPSCVQARARQLPLWSSQPWHPRAVVPTCVFAVAPATPGLTRSVCTSATWTSSG